MMTPFKPANRSEYPEGSTWFRPAIHLPFGLGINRLTTMVIDRIRPKHISKFSLFVLVCILPSISDASYPWIQYEAESAETTAEIVGPSREFTNLATESSNRRYVRLESSSEWVEFTVAEPANGLVLRYSLPDGPTGGGLSAKLNWWINDSLQRPLTVTSRFAWVYGHYPWTNTPRDGDARRFFDESSFKIPQLAAGDRIRFALSTEEPADWLALDFIELEQIVPPLPQPEGSISIVHYGAVPHDGLNDRAAFLAAVEAAKANDAPVWIPEGSFELMGPRIEIGGVRVAGAGIWHSRLTGEAAKFEGTGEPVHFADLAIFGNIDTRDNQSPDNAFNGNFGKGSTFTNLWIEHMKCAFWTLNGTDGLILSDSRIRNMMADGLNFCDGTSRSLVQNTHIRNTGDDALATWSPTGDWSSQTACVENKFINNLIEQPWHANGIGIYGGTGHQAVGNTIRDTVHSGAGVLVSSGFEAIPLEGTILVEENQIVSTGGVCYIGEDVGGLWFHAKDSDVEASIIARNNTVTDSADSGISVHGPKAFLDLNIMNNRVEQTSGPGLRVWPHTGGELKLSGNEWIDLGGPRVELDPSATLQLVGGE
jgi:hypothetical protein